MLPARRRAGEGVKCGVGWNVLVRSPFDGRRFGRCMFFGLALVCGLFGRLDLREYRHLGSRVTSRVFLVWFILDSLEDCGIECLVEDDSFLMLDACSSFCPFTSSLNDSLADPGVLLQVSCSLLIK